MLGSLVFWTCRYGAVGSTLSCRMGSGGRIDQSGGAPVVAPYKWNSPKALTTSRLVASVRSLARSVPSLIT